MGNPPRISPVLMSKKSYNAWASTIRPNIKPGSLPKCPPPSGGSNVTVGVKLPSVPRSLPMGLTTGRRPVRDNRIPAPNAFYTKAENRLEARAKELKCSGPHCSNKYDDESTPHYHDYWEWVYACPIEWFCSSECEQWHEYLGPA